MNTGKTTKQVEDHYWLNFMGSHGYCLPPQFLDENKNIVAVADLFPESNEDDLSSNDLYRIPVIEGYSRGDPVIRDMGVPNSTKAKDRNEINAKIAQMHGSEIPGYMPLRQDFECEFDNDAEAPLADMEFSPEDHPSEIALKLDVVRIYNQKVEERAKRRNFVIERDLIDVKGQQTVSHFSVVLNMHQ
jgi:transcriptional adapter 2-alpha